MDEERNQLRHSFIFTIRLVAIPFVVFLITFIFSIDLSGFGVYAREVSGLKGIIFAPLVHGSWGHLLSNLPPLFVSVFMIHYFYRKYFWGIFLSCYLLTGFFFILHRHLCPEFGIDCPFISCISHVQWYGCRVISDRRDIENEYFMGKPPYGSHGWCGYCLGLQTQTDR